MLTEIKFASLANHYLLDKRVKKCLRNEGEGEFEE